MNDEMIFADETEVEEILSTNSNTEDYWKLLIVDDDKEIHKITKLVLSEFNFEHKQIEFLQAYSASEAKAILNVHHDIAIILLDVVMESDHSGLDLVKYIRSTQKNSSTRIILRTGQPGQAPEREIIENYDINDYKEKTELTAEKLITTVISSIRSYMGICTIEKLNNELEQKVIDRTAQLRASLSEIEQDQEAGRKVQFKLLPKNSDRIHGLNFSHKILPSLFLSGDFVDYFAINNSKVGFYIADVSGHGASSAFVTILLKSYFNNLLDKYSTESDETILDPSKVLSMLNQTILEDDLDKHLTLWYGIIDYYSNSITFSNGAHYPHPILYTANKAQYLEYKGFPIGLIDNATYKNISIDLPEQFTLLFFSDGVLEVLEEQDLEKQKDILLNTMKNQHTDLDSIIAELGVTEISSKPDDLTFLMVKKSERA